MKRQHSTTVGIEVIGTRLRLRLPRQATSPSIPRYISTGLEDDKENRKTAQIAAWAIEADIKANRLAETYLTYVNRFKPVTALNPQPSTLASLWASYCDYKKPQLSLTTYTTDYCKKWANHIAKLPQSLHNAVAIRNHIIAQLSIDTAKRLLTVLSACFSWAVESGLVTANPFSGMAAKLKRPKAERAIDPFTITERDNILQAFQEHPTHSHYYSFVKFLFLTGCRTGEAIGLQWKHIAADLSSITFTQSFSSKLRTTKGTKTGKTRKFPCNSDLRGLLATIKPLHAKPTDLVFTSPSGRPIDNGKFTSRIWKGCKAGGKTYIGIMPSLIASGAVEAYRSPYHTRHTFITLMVRARLTIPQIAELVGNSPEIILKHYAGSSIDEVPIV